MRVLSLLCGLALAVSAAAYSASANDSQVSQTEKVEQLLKSVNSTKYIDYYKAYAKAFETGEKYDAFALLNHAVKLASKKLKSDHKSLVALRVNRLSMAASGYKTADYSWKSDAKEVPALAKKLYGEFSDNHITASVDAANLFAQHKYDRSSQNGHKLLTKLARDYDQSINPDPILSAYIKKMAAINLYQFGMGQRGLKYLDYVEEVYAEQALDANFPIAEIDFWRAKIALQNSKKSKAAKYLDKALPIFDKEAPNSAQAMLAYAFAVNVYSKTNQDDKATRYCRAIASVKPSLPDQELVPIYRVQPKYPRSAQQSGREGFVIVELTVDDAGQVDNPIVVERNGPVSLERAALDAVKRFRYVPGFKDGKPAPVEGVTYKFSFSLAG